MKRRAVEADRVGRDHRGGRVRSDPGRGGSLDAHRALNDRDTVPRRLSLLKTSSTLASLVIPAAHWAETTTVPAVGEVLRRDTTHPYYECEAGGLLAQSCSIKRPLGGRQVVELASGVFLQSRVLKDGCCCPR